MLQSLSSLTLSYARISHPITKLHQNENVCRKCLLSISQFSTWHLLLPTTSVTVFAPSFPVCYLSHHCWQTSYFGKRWGNRLRFHLCEDNYNKKGQATLPFLPVSNYRKHLVGDILSHIWLPRATWIWNINLGRLKWNQLDLYFLHQGSSRSQLDLNNCTELQGWWGWLVWREASLFLCEK